MHWVKKASSIDGVTWWTEDGRYVLCRSRGGQERRWELCSVGEFTPKPGGYSSREFTKLAAWPISPTAPTVKASEWLEANVAEPTNPVNK